jgi:hypothetical protein
VLAALSQRIAIFTVLGFLFLSGRAIAEEIDAETFLKPRTLATRGGGNVKGLLLRVLKNEVVVLSLKDYSQFRISRNALSDNDKLYARMIENQIEK